MAMFQPIPLPQLDKKWGDVMDYIEELQKNKAQREKYKQEEKRLGEELSLRKAAEQRAAQLFPTQLESAKAGLVDQQLMNQLMQHLQQGGGIDNFTPTTNSSQSSAMQQNQQIPQIPQAGQAPQDQPGSNVNAQNAPNDQNSQQSDSNINPNALADFIAARKKIPVESHIVNGYRVSHNPLTGKTVREKVGPNITEEQLQKNDAEKIVSWENTSEANIQSQPLFDQVSKILSDPEWHKMRQFPIAPGLELAYYKIKGTPEQKDLIGKFESYTNDFITNSIKDFGSRFTNQDLNFLKSMKVTGKDTLEGSQGKFQAIVLLRDLAGQRAEMAAKIWRQGGVTPHEAFIKANNALEVDKTREEIEEKITGKKAKLNKSHVTEKNILHTMEETGLSREEVMKKLKAKGLT